MVKMITKQEYEDTLKSIQQKLDEKESFFKEMKSYIDEKKIYFRDNSTLIISSDCIPNNYVLEARSADCVFSSRDLGKFYKHQGKIRLFCTAGYYSIVRELNEDISEEEIIDVCKKIEEYREIDKIYKPWNY